MEQIAQEYELKAYILQRYERAGRCPISFEIHRRDDLEPNWTARAVPEAQDFDDKRAFIAAVAQVRRLYVLAVD